MDRINEKEELSAQINGKKIDSWFQPIVDLFTNSVYAYEMLARGTGRFFNPGEMFAVAERNNLDWELEYACRMAALEKISHLDSSHSETYFFLNVSPHIFNNPDFKKGFTSSYIKEHGLNHRKIVLEITERASIEKYSLFENLIQHYVEQGFKVALDDFGAGHSGLTTLIAMTPHFMKIDREIVHGISISPYKQNLMRTLCHFASDVGSSVLAEGIECYEDLETVFRLGVRYVQGFYLGRPASSPQGIIPETLAEMNQLIGRFKISDFSTSSFLNDIVIRPDTFPLRSVPCRELDSFFKRNQVVDHVVITEGDRPLRLITRQVFYNLMSGRFGYSLFAHHFAEEMVKVDFLEIKESVDLLTIKKIALARNGSNAFDPIVITKEDGTLSGTITMKNLIEKAIDLEIFNAMNQNPLTHLPGNSNIRLSLKQLASRDCYSIVYIDIDHFKQYNDTYGFDQGDRMITLLSDILKDFRAGRKEDAFLGHIGGDDFIFIFHSFVLEADLQLLCYEFDSRKLSLFSENDRALGHFKSTDRSGQESLYPLTTISLAAFSSGNFRKEITPGELAHYAAELKSKVKKSNYEKGKSGYIYESRFH